MMVTEIYLVKRLEMLQEELDYLKDELPVVVWVGRDKRANSLPPESDEKPLFSPASGGRTGR